MGDVKDESFGWILKGCYGDVDGLVMLLIEI